MNPQEMIDKIDVEYLSAFLIEFGMNLLAALAIFIIGRWIARALANLARRAMTRANVDETLVGFIGNLTYIGLLAFTVLAALSALGIQTTSFIAVLGAAGLAVGLALQGSLANFAAGVLMLIFRPFKLGDFVEAAGTAGVVEDIHIFTCQLRTPDNKTIIVPNGHIMSGNITNYSAKPKRRVDFVFGVGYEANIDTVKAVIEDQVKKDDRILLDDGITIGVLELADSSVNFAVRVWVNAADYWDVFFHTNEAMKKRFDAEGISIPFPQRDIHLHQVNA